MAETNNKQVMYFSVFINFLSGTFKKKAVTYEVRIPRVSNF